MCLLVNLFDSEGDDVELVHPGGLYDRVANASLGISEPPSQVASSTKQQQVETSGTSRNFRLGSPMPQAFNSIKVQNQIPTAVSNLNPIPQQSSGSVLENLYKNMRKLQAIGEKSEGFRDELLITLVGVTGQNAMQMPWSSSSSCLRYVAMAANCMAFISLLSGVLLRSKTVTGREDRRRLASYMLVMLGISLTAAGPMLNMSMNISGVGGYFVPLVCLLPIIGVFT